MPEPGTYFTPRPRPETMNMPGHRMFRSDWEYLAYIATVRARTVDTRTHPALEELIEDFLAWRKA